jgi:hypothetical protein
MLEVAAQSGKVEHLSFSECGRYCVMTNEHELRPKVFDLPSKPLFSNSPQTHLSEAPVSLEASSIITSSTAGSHLSTSLGQLTKDASSALSVLEVGSTQKQVLRDTNFSIQPDGSQSLMHITNSGNSVNVSKQWTDGLTETVRESVTLVLLPSWPGAASLKPNVVLPSSESEPVRVVLDKVAKTWNSLSGSATDIRFPAIVERDQRSFRRPSRRIESLTQE